jgi:anti-sigma regulatory factor (Ser/Thr protein kinase)
VTTFPVPTPFAEPWEYELRFPRDPRGPGIARATLHAVLAAHGLREMAGRAELLTSELATNAVRYADGPAGVRLTWLHPVLRISVWDTNPQIPAPLKPPPDLDSGRGLLILEVFADRWGGCAMGEEVFGLGGKTIWFELTLGRGRPHGAE